MAGLPPLSPRPSPYAHRKSYQGWQGFQELDSSTYDLNMALNHFRKRAVLEEDVRQIFERQDANDDGTNLESTSPRPMTRHHIPRSASASSLSSSASNKSTNNKQVHFLDHPEVFIIPMDRDWILSRRSPISLF